MWVEGTDRNSELPKDSPVTTSYLLDKCYAEFPTRGWDPHKNWNVAGITMTVNCFLENFVSRNSREMFFRCSPAQPCCRPLTAARLPAAVF